MDYVQRYWLDKRFILENTESFIFVVVIYLLVK